jgi:hypothetical protein
MREKERERERVREFVNNKKRLKKVKRIANKRKQTQAIGSLTPSPFSTSIVKVQ